VVRWRQLHDHIEANTSQHWALAFVNHMVRMQKAREHAPGSETALTAEELLAVASTPGAGVLVVVDGDVLWPLEDAAPTEGAQDVLKRLSLVAADARVTGVVVTSRAMGAIDSLVKPYPSLHVVAESGCCVRLPVLMRLPPTTEMTSSVGRALAKQLASTEYPLSFHGSIGSGGARSSGSRPKAADLFASLAPASLPPAGGPAVAHASTPVHSIRLAGGLTPRARESGGQRERTSSTTSIGAGGGVVGTGVKVMDHLPRAAAVGARWHAVCPEVEGAPARTLQSPHVSTVGIGAVATPATPGDVTAPGSDAQPPTPSWKAAVRSVIARFAEATPGATVVETVNTVQLHVGGVDPELEAWQCKQLGLELELVTTVVPVDAVLSRSGVLVRPRQASLSHALTHIVDDTVMQGCPPPATVVVFAAARDSHRIVADSVRMEPVLRSLQAALQVPTAPATHAPPPPSVAVRFAALIHPHFDTGATVGSGGGGDTAAPARSPSPAMGVPAGKYGRLPSDATAMRLADLAKLLQAAAGAVRTGDGEPGAGGSARVVVV